MVVLRNESDDVMPQASMTHANQCDWIVLATMRMMALVFLYPYVARLLDKTATNLLDGLRRTLQTVARPKTSALLRLTTKLWGLFGDLLRTTATKTETETERVRDRRTQTVR